MQLKYKYNTIQNANMQYNNAIQFFTVSQGKYSRLDNPKGVSLSDSLSTC